MVINILLIHDARPEEYQVMKGVLRSVTNDGHYTWIAKYFFFCISAFSTGNSLVHYDYHIPRTCYKHCDFDGDQAIMTFTYFESKVRFHLSLSFY